MKKKLALLLSSVILFGSAYGFVGCGEEDPTQTPGGGTPMTEEQIFTGIKSAVAGFMSYNGSMTAKTDMVMEMEMTADNLVQKMCNEALISYDVAGEKAFITSVSTEDTYTISEDQLVPVSTEKEVNKEKYYKQDGVYYYYQDNQETQNDQPTEDSYSIFIKDNGDLFEEFKADQTMSGASQEEMEMVFGSAVIASSFAELKTAYETVYAEQLATQKLIDETATATAVVSATENDGVMVLSVETTAQTTVSQNYIVAKTASTVIEAKNGLLSKIVASQTETIFVDVEGELTPMVKITVSSLMEFEKTFDAEGFNAIVIDSTLEPEDNTQTETVDFELIYYTFEKYEVGFSGAPEDTLADAMDNFLESPSETYTYSWYLDEELTTPADFTKIKLGDKQATVYAKINVNEGYAILNVHEEKRDDSSKNYKIAFSNNLNSMMADGNGRHEVYLRQISETGANVETLIGNGREIWVNGVKVNGNIYGLTYESGVYYDIEYVDVTTDADYNIFTSSFMGE